MSLPAAVVATEPTAEGRRRFPPDGYRSGGERNYMMGRIDAEDVACVCSVECAPTCDGGCGCEACDGTPTACDGPGLFS